MLLLGLLEETCSGIRERLERIRSSERPTPKVLEGSRFGCQNSGACCHGYVFGSISEQEKARIEALNPREAIPHLSGNPLFVKADLILGRPTYKLATVNDTCVFLEPGLQCGLHRAFGPSAKPGMCQLFPLSAIATIDGLKIYNRGECATFAVSSETGTLLESDIPRIRALVDESIYHPVVWVHRSWQCDYGLILMLARRLDKEATSRPSLEALSAIGHIVRGFIVSLTRCPLDTGQPERCVTTTLGMSAADFRPSQEEIDSNVLVGLERLATISKGLAERVSTNERLAPQFIEEAMLLNETCRHMASGHPLSERAKSVISVSVGGDIESALTLSLRQQIFGRDLLLDNRLPAGLLRMALVIALTITGARALAVDDGKDKVLPTHLSSSHVVTKRTLGRPEPHRLLRANGEQVWPILEALPLLAFPPNASDNIPVSK